jgi:predicted kinase
MNQKLIILEGLPASGKSTYARELVAQGYKRVNKDDLRAMVDNSKWSDKNEKEILAIRDELIYTWLLKGFNIVVDDTNFSENHINTIAELVKKTSFTIKSKIDIEVKFIDTPLYECIERDAKRENPVGKKVILRMYNQYLSKPPQDEIDDNLPACIICDIDGTLAYMNGRSPYDYSAVSTDLPNKKLIEILRKLSKYPLFVFSGRKPICRVDTAYWLYQNGVSYQELVMRESDDDDRPDDIVKQEYFDKYIKGKYNVLAVFDDRPKVIRMWKDLGLFVMDCNRMDSRIDF